ncbi:hypothetical protein U5640_22820 [Streptomyces sp. SS7]|uniref:hypothetical protein n=1 Tax=Streptomyces sp. SS7 TaxID=3108485 RepID=UPI0030ECFA53
MTERGERLVVQGTDVTADAVVGLLGRHRVTAAELRLADVTGSGASPPVGALLLVLGPVPRVADPEQDGGEEGGCEGAEEDGRLDGFRLGGVGEDKSAEQEGR